MDINRKDADEEHNLMAVRYAFSGGDHHRDTVAAKYAPGKRCLVISISEPKPSTDYVFIDVNSSGKITEFYFDSGKNYHFKLDEEPPENEPFGDFRPPESVVESLFNRAQIRGVRVRKDASERAVQIASSRDCKITVRHEIARAVPPLDRRGDLTEPGYAKKLLPVYDRSAVKGGFALLKERDYYYVGNDRFGLSNAPLLLTLIFWGQKRAAHSGGPFLSPKHQNGPIR